MYFKREEPPRGSVNKLLLLYQVLLLDARKEKPHN